MDEFARALASDRAHDAVERVQQLLTTVEKAGHHGNAGTLLLMLARLHATSGDDAARAALVRARSRPGPYAGLVVDLVDRRLAALEPAGGAGGADATRTPPPPNMPARASQS